MVLRDGRRLTVVGHRGAAARAPENTAASLRAGLDAGADAIEVDVGLAADGRVVLLHDRTLDRTTDGRGPLSRRAWRDLERLDAGSWFSERFRGEGLLDLDAALALVRGRVPLIVEIKAGARPGGAPLSHAERLLVEAVLAALERTGGVEAGVQISSAHWAILEKARALCPALSIALTAGLRRPADPMEVAAQIRASALHVNRLICTRSLVGRAHDLGLEVIAYTVNRAGELFPLVELGADGVFTDDPAAIRRFLERRLGEAGPSLPLTLGVDQGSGGTRAVLLSADGRLVASREVRVASRRERSGGFVQDAEAVAASVARAAGPLLEDAPGPVAGIGIAAQRSSLVVWRRSSGAPVTPVLSWRVGATGIPPDWLSREREVRERTGLTSHFPYGAIRLQQLAQGDLEIARGLAGGSLVAGPLGSFLAARLTATDKGLVDPSLAQRLLLLDFRSRRWDSSLAMASGIPLETLPRLARSCGSLGTARVGRKRLPLRALVGDVGAAARAVLGPSGRGGLLVLGTGGFLVAGTGGEPASVPELLTSILWEDADGPRYGIEGTVHGVLTSLLEAGRRAGLGDLAPEVVAARSGPASRAPRVAAAPEGVGTPDWDLTPRFEVEGGDWSAEELARGTVLSIAERFGRIADLLREAGRLPESFVATGGLATPHLVLAISRRIGIPIMLDRRPHATATGAALLAR